MSHKRTSFSRSILAIYFVSILAIVALALGFAKPAQAACSATGVTGSTSTTVTVPADFAGSYRVWLEFRGSATASVSIEVDGGACITQSLSGVNASVHNWFAVGSAQSFAAGTRTLKIISYTPGMYVRNGMLISDTCVPTGDGSNCNTQATPTVSITPTATPTPSPTQAPPTTTPTLTPSPSPAPTLRPTSTVTPTPPVPTETIPAGTYNDNDSRIKYSSGWLVDTTDHYTFNAGSGLTASYKFIGTQTKIISTRVSDGGVLYVSIDGGPEKMADIRGTYLDKYAAFTSDSLTYGTHTVSIRTAKHPTAGTSNVNIDAIEVSGQAPPPTVINPPTNLKATAISSGQIDVTWSQSTTSTVTGYIVYRNGVEFARIGNTTKYSDLLLPAGTNFRYKLKAINAGGATSEFSSEVSATTQCGWFKC